MQEWNLLHKTSRKLQRRLCQERGQALVEFAIVLPLLMAIIFGILYFGRYEDYANQETQLAEEGARYAAVNYTPSSGTLQSYIQSQAQPELQNGSSDVSKAAIWIYQPSTQPSSPAYAIGNSVRVCVVTTVQYPALLRIGIGSSQVAQVATMRIEQISASPTLPYSTSGNAADGNPSGTMPGACPTP